jgi:hypothetical protein
MYRSQLRTMKNLPQELLDEIISHLPPDDKQSFRNCSLVAKSWIHPSRRLLFNIIGTLREATLWSRINDVSLKNAELLHHVHTLSVVIDISLHQRSPGAPAVFLNDESPAFPRLKHLVLYSGSSSSIVQFGVSLASRRTLESISLCCCPLTSCTLVTLINHFPKLAHLKLYSVFHDVDNEPIPPLSRPLRKLSIDGLDQLLELQSQRDSELTITVSPFVAPPFAQRIIDGVGATVKHLDLKFSMECKHEPKARHASY